MKKILIPLSAVAIATGFFALAGCGGVEDDPNAQDAGESVEPGTGPEGQTKDASGEPYEAGPEGGSQAGDDKEKKRKE